MGTAHPLAIAERKGPIMTNRNRRPAKDGRTIAGRKARQGEILLKTTPMRLVFIAGFVGVVVIALLFQWYL